MTNNDYWHTPDKTKMARTLVEGEIVQSNHNKVVEAVKQANQLTLGQ